MVSAPWISAIVIHPRSLAPGRHRNWCERCHRYLWATSQTWMKPRGRSPSAKGKRLQTNLESDFSRQAPKMPPMWMRWASSWSLAWWSDQDGRHLPCISTWLCKFGFILIVQAGRTFLRHCCCYTAKSEAEFIVSHCSLFLHQSLVLIAGLPNNCKRSGS